MKKLKKNLGVSLLELMLSLAIIAVLLIMATRYYSTTQTARQIQTATQSIQAIYSADQQYYIDNNGHAKISDLVTKYNLLPSGFSDYANPWGSIDDSNMPAVKFKSVPTGACNNIKDKIGNSIKEITISDCGTATTVDMTITFP